jgi:tetratricopeptide (TPR) repeat protein
MRKRVLLTLTTLLAVGSIGFATLLAVQKARPQRKASARKTDQRRPQQRPTATRTGALRAADPNRAPRAAVDDALYTSQDFFGSTAIIARPYAEASERVDRLIAAYAKDARLRLHATRLSERLGQFDKAAEQMAEYVALKGRSPDALRRLAGFYHRRARHSDQVSTLLEQARALPVGERAAIYKQAATLVRSHALAGFKPADFFAELVAADPSNIQPVKDHVEELRLAGKDEDALAVLESFQPKFPTDLEYFLQTRSGILEEAGDRKAAENAYSSAFDPTWPRAVAADYYDLLRRFGRYRIVRRGLQEQVKAGTTDLGSVARLFSIYSYEGSYAQAARLLTELEERRARPQVAMSAQNDAGSNPPSSLRYSTGELEMLANMFASIGHYDQASRYLYTLYLAGGLEAGSEQRERALYRLFSVLLDAAGTPTRVATGDLSFYRDIAEIDQHPGVMNGILSLILSGVEPAEEFANQEKVAAGYFNRRLAHRVFSAFKQEYPDSARLGEMYLGIVRVFSALGEHKLAIEAGREFQQRFPDSPVHAEVSLRIADSYVALKDRVGERAELGKVLDRLAEAQPSGVPLVPASPKRWTYGMSPAIDQLIDKIKYNLEAYSDTYDPTQQTEEEGGETEEDEEEDVEAWPGERTTLPGPTYSSVVERYVASLATEDKKTETVAFFWGEIKKHPREEGLYERFLRWLGQAQLVNEQLRAYNSAIRQFDSNTWYHRLARWYVRQKRGRELARYSRQLIDIFDEDEITDYLVRFAGYGVSGEGDELNWDQKLAYDLYNYAHNRFPRNLFFVRGMLTYLEKNDRARWEKLSTEYYFADGSVREPYLAWLSRQNQLRERYRQAREQASTGAGEQRGIDKLSYAVFAADAALWLSHHDEALDAYRQLAGLYPGEPQYAQRLADLTRSFGVESDKFYGESAAALIQMADIYPSDHTYRIKAGEVYAEMGDFRRASEQWNRLVELDPGDRETYLAVATVFWDYYQFDESIRVLKDLRRVTEDQNIYAYRLGAVYEGKGDFNSAISEYVKVLSEPGEGRDRGAKRLAQLSRRAGVAEKIAAAYERARAANPNDWQLVIGYAIYEAARERENDALALLRSEVARSTNVDFLETTRDLFRWILRPEDEQLVLERLGVVARDERESMMCRLQLASFLELANKTDASLAIIDKLVADHQTNLGVVEESGQFYWRAGRIDRALDLYKQTIGRARGASRRSLVLQLARRQIEAAKLNDAEATLRTFWTENRSDTEVFGELARALGLANKLPELEALYQEAFKDVREAGLGLAESRARSVELRAGMIRTLTGLGKFEAALDQHIEIINAYPEDADRLAAAIDFAERHKLIQRLTDYYEKLTQESYKNYRWQLVLGRIYERRGSLGAASDQYRAAVVNEPQRADLRFGLASVLARQRRYDEAIATLREGWSLAGRDPKWLVEVARLQVQQGRRDEAVETIRQAMAAKKNATVEAHLMIASQLAAWGLGAESVRVYEQALERLPKVLKEEYVSPEHILGYIKALVRVESAASAFQKAERLRAQYFAIAQNSQDLDSYKARSVVYALDQAMRSDFGRGVLDYSDASGVSELVASMRSTVAKLTTYGDREQLLRYLGIARAANLVDLEEQIHTQLKDAAFSARTRADDSRFYTELRALVGFYERHAAFARAAEVLAEEYQRDQYKDRFDYQRQIATHYRLAGDQARELEALRSAYAASSGSLTTDNLDWVDRYLSLLYSSGSRIELQRLASISGPHQIQLINFLIEKNERDMVLNAIERAKQSPAWVNSRSAEVGLFTNDRSPETEEFFKAALDRKPIGELIGRRGSGGRSLVGDDWYVCARNFGFWLGIVGRETESRDLVLGEVEAHVSGAGPHLELAAYYLERKNAARAGEHASLAAEISPSDRNVAVMRGSIALARGDRKAALEAWGSIINGKVTPDDALTYFKVAASNGFFRESLAALEPFVVAYVSRGSRRDGSAEGIEGIKPLVREIAGRAQGDARLTSDVASFLQRVIARVPGELAIGTLLIEESLLPESSLTGFYRLIHQRLSDIAAATSGTAEYENGYWSGSRFVYPARELAQWRRRLMDHLIRIRSFDEARLLVTTIEREQANLALASAEGNYEDRYEWLPLASALIELRSGRDVGKAIAELRSYCGLDGNVADEPNIEGFEERRLSAYALLAAEGRQADAEALLHDAYRAAVASRFGDDASFVGLAEIEARRGRGDEAARLLKLMVERSTDNLKSLQLAAETAARVGRYDDAINFREQIAQLSPDDANRLELARAIAAAGRSEDALERLLVLVGEKGVANRARAQAAELIGELVARNRSLVGRVATGLSDRAEQGDAASAIALAATAEADGRNEEARSRLAQVSPGPLSAVAHMRLGLIAAAEGRVSEAIASLEKAAYLDADGVVTDSIAFRIPGPRAQLISLYSRAGRDLTALRLAEGDQSGGRSLLAEALRVPTEGEGEAFAVSFEPSLEAARPESSGLKPLDEMNAKALAQSRRSLLASLAESAARVGQFERAIAIHRLRATEETQAEQRAAIERRLAEIVAAQSALKARLASLLRVSRSNTTQSIYAARFLEAR